MKHKNVAKGMLIAMMLSVSLFLMCGCDFLFGYNQSSTGSGGQSRPSLATPEIEVYGNVIMWKNVDGATSYVVSGNGYNEEVTQTFFAPKQPSGGSYTVTAKSATKTSEASEAVSVFNTKSSGGKSQSISLTDHETYTIESTTTRVTITGEGTDCSVKINDRTSPLHIILNNVSIVSPQKTACIGTYDGEIDKKYTVIVEISGVNQLTSSDVTTIPSKPSTNSGRDGGAGYSGGQGLLLPNIVLIGNGTLNCKGGNGGKGGDGADSAGLSLQGFGSGGNGGSGGSGIKCTNFFLNLSGEGIVYSVGGKGGAGGVPGANGSIITGPVGSMVYDKYYGKEGVDGIAVRGTVMKISGMSEF